MHNHEFNFKPSISYLVLLSLFVLGSLAVTLTIPADWRIRLFLFLAVAVYGGQIIWCYGLLKGKNAIHTLKALPDDQWLLITKTGRFEAVLRGDSTVTHLVSILRVEVEGQRFPPSCTIFKDSLPPDDYRRLVVAIRHR
jgi:hypothetical protein